MGQTAFVLKWMQAYQSIVTMESSLRLPEKAKEKAGFPWQALGMSLAFHALALATFAPLADIAPESAAANRTLTAMLQPPIPLSVAGAVPPAPTFSPSKLTQSQRSAPHPPSPADSLPATQLSEVQATVPPRGPSSAGEARGEFPLRSGVGPAADALAVAETQGADAAGLRQYRLALAGEAKRFRRYPDMARRMGLSGTAEVRVIVTAASGGRQASLNRSSGHPALDEVALEILRLAAERAELPATLRGQNFAVLLPVVFEVEE